MSGTAGMLSALSLFNNKNTGTFYPELYKIKMLVLNANKFVPTPVTYTYTAGATATYLMDILRNLTILFPDIFIYYNKTNGNKDDANYGKYIVGDGFSTTSGNTYSIYISQSQISIWLLLFSTLWEINRNSFFLSRN